MGITLTNVYWEVTDSPDEDGISAAGWSLSNRSLWYESDEWKVRATGHAFRIEVNGAAIPNALPTAASATVTTKEDTTYTFAAGNFSLSDTDIGDTLQVKITSLPGTDKGTLWLNDGNNTFVTGEEVSVDDSAAAADITKLKYTPPANANGDPFTTFNFKVNDGYEDSASGYTITVDVTAVNDAQVVTGRDRYRDRRE